MAMNVQQQRALAVARARRRKADILATGERMKEIPGDRIAGAFEAAAPMEGRQVTSGPESFMGGALQGATMGLADEGAAGLALLGIPPKAAGLPIVGPGLATLGLGRAIVGGEDYDREVAERRLRMQMQQSEHPIASTTGEIAGGIATAPLMPGGAGAGMGTRMARGALAGVGYGGAYGAGTAEGGLEERALGGLVGAGAGGVVGGAAPAIVRTVQGAGNLIGKGVGAVTRPLRGLINTDKEAARQIAIQMAEDAANPKQVRLSLADEASAIAAGQPVFNVDRGGAAVRALARSSANRSPQARSSLETAVKDRFQAQGNRVMDAVKRIVGNVTAQDNRISLQLQATKINKPAYQTAYDDPAAQDMWDAGLEQLASAPVVQSAMKQAAVTGRNAASLGGFQPFDTPFMVDKATGGLKLRGNMRPTLQFWDHVKRNLDGMGVEGQQAAKVLREYLDQLVPVYKAARAGAASFFNAQDALEAGETFVSSRMSNDIGRAGIAKLSVPERKLFEEGFADALVRKVSEASDRRSVINSIFLSSPAARERIEIALGPQKAKELEIFMRIEDLLDRARQEMGNSTTARQLVELGIGTGAAGYGYGTGDWKNAGTVLTGVLVSHGLFRIDRKVAQRIGEMLASPDPAVTQRGLQIIARNGRYMEALRAADIPAAATGAAQATGQAQQMVAQ